MASSEVKKSYVHVRHTRTPKQQEQYEQIAREGVCPFCPEHLRRFHEKLILHETKNWLVTENDTPYEGARLHVLVISRPHRRRIKDLPMTAWAELGMIFGWIEDHYSIASGAIGMRFGDIPDNGASVDHLHAHVVVADPDAPAPPRFKMGKSSR